jgi:hypothetical protein
VTTTILDALGRLNASLDNLARALQTGEADEVLDAEAPLAEAVQQLSTLSRQRGAPGAIEERIDAPPLREGVIAAHVSLLRCQSLGNCAVDLADAISRSGYGWTGMRVRSEIPVPSVNSRT